MATERATEIYAGIGPVIRVGTVINFKKITNITPHPIPPPDSLTLNVTSPEHNFTGREDELHNLHNALQRSVNSIESLITVVTGLGGIGKTQLVREYVRRQKSEYGGNVIWIDAEQEENVVETFKRLAKDHLGIPTMDANGREKNDDSVVQSVYDFFRNKNVLFIFDNVESMETIRKFLHSLSEPSTSTHRSYVLLTSRGQEWSTGIEVIQIGEWKVDEAIAFVRSMLSNSEDKIRDMQKLVDVLQCFPLALRQATSYIINQRETGDYSLSNYLNEYEKQKKVLLDSKEFQKGVTKYTATTFTTWNITIRAIQQDMEYGALAFKILNTLAYFDPDNIFRSSLLELANQSEESTVRSLGKYFIRSVGSVLSDVLNVPNISQLQIRTQKKLLDNEALVKKAVSLLIRYSMISSEVEDKQAIFSIHRVVQDVIKITLKSKGMEKTVLRDALILMKKNLKRVDPTRDAASVFGHAFGYPDLVQEFFDLPNLILMNLITRHWFPLTMSFGHKILAKFEYIFGSNHQILDNIKLNMKFAKYVDGNLVYLIKDDSLYSMYDQVYQMRVIEFGENDVDTIDVKLILGYILMYMQNMADASKIFEEVLDKYNEINDEDRRYVAMGWMGNVYCNFKLYKEALLKKKQSYELSLTKFGESHPFTLYALDAMGVVQLNQKNFTDALVTFKKICDKAKENRTQMGDNNDDEEVILHSMLNMGLTHCELGNYLESLGIFREVLAKRNKKLGADHKETLRTSNAIGHVLFTMKNYTEAVKVFQTISVVGLRDDRDDLDMILYAMYFEAMAHFELGNYKDSLRVYRMVHAARVKILGEDHPDTLDALNGIGHALLKQSNYADALHTFEEIHNQQLKLGLGDVNEAILDALYNIGLTHFEQGSLEESLSIFKKVHAERLKVLGEKHENTLSALNRIGGVLFRQENLTEALTHFEYICDKGAELEDGNSIILGAMCNMQLTHFELGNYKDALDVFQKICYKGMKLPEDNQIMLTAIQNSALIYIKLGSYTLSLKASEHVYSKYTKKFGENHSLTLSVSNNIGIALLELGHYNDCLKILQYTCKQINELGSDHEVILEAMENMGLTYFKLGNYEKSLDIFKNVQAEYTKLFGENHRDTLRILKSISDVLLAQGHGNQTH